MTPILAWLETKMPPKLAKLVLAAFYAFCLFQIIASLGVIADYNIIYRDVG